MSSHLSVPYELDENFVPVLRSDSVIRFYQNEAVAWSRSHPEPAYLDPVAATVLQILDGSASIGELVVDIHEVMAIQKDVALAQVARVVGLLNEQALLVDPTAGPATDVAGLSSSIFGDPPNP